MRHHIECISSKGLGSLGTKGVTHCRESLRHSTNLLLVIYSCAFKAIFNYVATMRTTQLTSLSLFALAVCSLSSSPLSSTFSVASPRRISRRDKVSGESTTTKSPQRRALPKEEHRTTFSPQAALLQIASLIMRAHHQLHQQFQFE